MTLGRLEKHYRVCLSADASGRKDAAAATLLHSQVRPTAVQGLLACGVKNAQSASAAREHLDRVYRTSGHRQATDGILESVYWLRGGPGEAAQRARGDRGTGPGAARGPLGSAEGAAPPWGAEATAAVPCEPGRRRSRGHEYGRPQREIQENGHNGRDDGVYPHRRPRGGAAGDGHVDDDQEEGVGVAAGMLRYVRYYHQLQPQPQPRMFEPEPEPYVKMEQEWEQEWEWRGKQEYVDPGEAEGEWWEQYERPLTQEEVQEEEPMQAEGRAIVCSMFCMPP